MANISDIIEQFIIENLGKEMFMDLSRNELAEFFNVAPSQINYVLSTRFNFERGYMTQSRRGGGGYIRLAKLDMGKIDYIKSLLESIGDTMDYSQAISILLGLTETGYLTISEKEKISCIMSPKALCCPIKIENSVRAKMMRNLLQSFSREV